MQTPFTSKHLKENNITYFSHLRRSMYFSTIFFIASIEAFIHALYPDLYQTSSTDTVILLNKELNKEN